MKTSGAIRRGALALVAGLAGMAGTPAAQADFHPACIGIVTGNAYLTWTAGASHVASGTVECPGAYSVTVTITITSLTDEEFETVTETSACSILDLSCLDPVTASHSADFEDGTYELHMSFDAEGPVAPATTYTGVQRCGVWTVTGDTADGPNPC